MTDRITAVADAMAALRGLLAWYDNACAPDEAFGRSSLVAGQGIDLRGTRWCHIGTACTTRTDGLSPEDIWHVFWAPGWDSVSIGHWDMARTSYVNADGAPFTPQPLYWHPMPPVAKVTTFQQGHVVCIWKRYGPLPCPPLSPGEREGLCLSP